MAYVLDELSVAIAKAFDQNELFVTPLQHDTAHEFGRFRVTVSTSGNPWVRAAGYELFVVHVYIHGMSRATLTSKTFPRLPRSRFPQGRCPGFRTRTRAPLRRASSHS